MLRRVLLLALLALGRPAAAAPAAPVKVKVTARAPLKVGLSGYAGVERATADAASLRAFLEARLGRPVQVQVLPGDDALAVAVADGDVDLAWLSPLKFMLAERLNKKVQPVAKVERHGFPFYRGVLFTRADRPFENAESLRGASIAWVEKSSAAGFLFPRAALLRSGVKLEGFFKSERMAGNHAAACRAVAAGEADVGATFADDRGKAPRQLDGCLQELGAEAAGKLKIVLTSAPIPNDLMVARSDLPASDVAELGALLLGLGQSTEGKALLSGVFKADRFVEVGADDFEPVRFATQGMAP